MFERKKLGLLQPNLQGKLSYQGGKIVLESPTSRKRKNNENQTPVKSARKDGIYEDPVTPLTKRAKHCPISGVDAAVQTERTPLTPTANCQAAISNVTGTAIASTSSNDSSLSLVLVSAPQVRDFGIEAATPIENRKTVSKSEELETLDEKWVTSTSNATESAVQAKVEVQKSLGEREQMSTEPQAIIDMLINEVPGERYWEMLAAERKAALITALSENRLLYQRNSELQDRVHYLDHENILLNNMLREANTMADLLESVTQEQNGVEVAEKPPTDASEDAPLNPSEEEKEQLSREAV